MSSRLELGPADLDRLEDALEDLELRPALELEADDPVAARLLEYRALLQLGRSALPLEDVPAGLLDGVLAQARQAVAAGAAGVAPKPSFWARWRLGTWVPTLAFAGSAALLLLVLVPKGEAPAPTAVAQSESSAPSMAAAEPPASDGRLADAQLGRHDETKRDEALRGAGVAIGERAREAEPAPPIEEPEPESEPEPAVDLEAQAVTDGAARHKAVGDAGSATGGARGSTPKPKGPPGKAMPSTPMPTSKAPPTSSGGKGKADAKPDPLGDDVAPQKKEDEAGGDSWPEISRADADRRGGNCGLAKMRYDKLRKLDDPRVRARALAGLGLCEAAADDSTTAKKLFDQARAADPDVSIFIDRELAALERARADDPSPQAAD